MKVKIELFSGSTKVHEEVLQQDEANEYWSGNLPYGCEAVSSVKVTTITTEQAEGE